MIALIQRVSEARVVVDGEITGEIGHGLLVLLGVERGDEDLGDGRGVCEGDARRHRQQHALRRGVRLRQARADERDQRHQHRRLRAGERLPIQ